jgi:predicted nucleotidyltransferase
MGPESDVDIMVEFEPGFRIGLIRFESLVEELESLAERRVSPGYAQKFSKMPASSMRHAPSFLKDILSAWR